MTFEKKCEYVTQKMQLKFPELKRVRGFITYPGMDPMKATNHPFNAVGYMHWWLVTKDGEIVDPTVAQFAPHHPQYEEYCEEHHGEMPSGKCYTCGGMCYGSNTTTCSIECSNRLLFELNFK
jgi:hypothetical protein